MSTTTALFREQIADTGLQPSGHPGARRSAIARTFERLARFFSPRRSADIAAIGPDEAGDATLHDLGLEYHRPGSTYDFVAIHPGIESARMHLFTMTGRYWRGS
jgi:hypothetical protein